MEKYLFEVGQQLADVFYNQENIKPLNQNNMIEVTFNYKGEVRRETLKNSTLSKAYDYVVNKYVGSKIKSIVWL